MKKCTESLTCYKKGVIFASGIVYPAVRTKEARIRISVLASHEITQMGNCRRQRHYQEDRIHT